MTIQQEYICEAYYAWTCLLFIVSLVTFAGAEPFKVTRRLWFAIFLLAVWLFQPTQGLFRKLVKAHYAPTAEGQP